MMVCSDTCASSSLRTSSLETCAKSVSGAASSTSAVHKVFIRPPEDGPSVFDACFPAEPLYVKRGAKYRHSGGGSVGLPSVAPEGLIRKSRRRALLRVGVGLPRFDGVGEAALNLGPQGPVGRRDLEGRLVVRDRLGPVALPLVRGAAVGVGRFV